MTLLELKQRVDACLQDERNNDLIVCIPSNESRMGGISVTEIKFANRGIDWDASKFILWPEVKMVNRKD